MSRLLIAIAIELFSNLYGVPQQYAECVCAAESRYDANAVGDNGRALGPWQWHVPSWTETRLEMGLDPDPALRADPVESTVTAFYAMSHGKYHWWSTDAGCRALREPVAETPIPTGGEP